MRLLPDISTQFRSAALVDRCRSKFDYNRIHACPCLFVVLVVPLHVRTHSDGVDITLPISLVHRAASAFVQTRREVGGCSIAPLRVSFQGVDSYPPIVHTTGRIWNRCRLLSADCKQQPLFFNFHFFYLFVLIIYKTGRSHGRRADFCYCARPFAAHFDTFSFSLVLDSLRHL